MFATWSVLSPAAWACAGLVHVEGDLAESDHAEVVFATAGGEVEVSYRVGYTGTAAEFGWVIPVPGDVAAVEDGDADLFQRLRGLTAPTVSYETGSGSDGGGCALGCGSGSKAGGSPTSTDGLTIVAEGFTGTYDFVVVEATDPAGLQAWLDAAGWSGLAEEDLEHYVDLGASFVALSLHPDVATTPSGGRDLPPLRVRYAGGEQRFPSVLARNAAVDTQRTTVWVVGDTRATVSGWSSEDPTRLQANGLDPAVVFLDALGALGADQRWLRSWAGPGEGAFVTRFDTWAPAEVHDTDAVFAFEASTEELHTSIDATDGGGSTASLGLLVGCGLWVRRRAQPSSRTLPIEK